MTNWSTIGHMRQKKELLKNLKEDNLAHAYLFSGPKHVGKLQLAKEFAKLIICEDSICNTCSCCLQVDKLSHPDLIVLDRLFIDGVNDNLDEIANYTNLTQAHRAKTPKAKTDVITINDIRELQKILQNKSLGKNRVCIIRNIDRLNTESTNAFLKTVEEPPQGLTFIFTSANENKILETLISRLRIIRFNLLNDELIEKSLMNDEDKEEIINFAQGRIKVALKMSEDKELLKKLKSKYSEIEEIYQNADLVKKFDFAKFLSENSSDLKRFFEYSQFYLRSLLRKGDQHAGELIKHLKETESMVDKNVNKKLALENFLLKTEK